MAILNKIREILPSSLHEKLYEVKLFLIDNKKWRSRKYWGSEKKVSYGEKNDQLTFYVIRKNPKATGLLSCYLSALAQLREIDGTEYVPVIDMQTHFYPLIHNENEEGMSINAWEHYFMPISEYSMDEVLLSKNVILSRGVTIPSGTLFFDETDISEEIIKEWVSVDKKFFKLRPELQTRFDNKRSKLLNDKRVLGIMVREGYMVLAEGRDNHSKYYLEHPGIEGHPVQPSIGELCKKIATLLSEWRCDYLYVVCETSFILDWLEERFPGKVLSTGRKRHQVSELSLDTYMKSHENFSKDYSMLESNYDYLEEVYILSKCTSLIAGKCSGSIVASLWNEAKYEHLEIFNKGLY